MQEAVIVSAVRTPIGSLNGALSPLSATQLGGLAIAEAVRRAGLPADAVDEVIMGNVLSAGEGQAPARQAAMSAGLPPSVGATTINKVCGSGLKAVMLAAQAIRLGDERIVVAGGMESMSNAPYLLEKARSGYRMGHGQLTDSLLKDGLWDVYNDCHMGSEAELCAEKYGLSREEIDRVAAESYNRALLAQRSGAFKAELLPVRVVRGARTEIVDADETPGRFDPVKAVSLKPVFKAGGTVTAANASSISDGAAALVVMSAEAARERNLFPLARIVGYASCAQAPEWFTMAPVDAIRRLLQKTGHALSDVDLFEINEAFAVSSLAVQKELGLSDDRVDVLGGSVALGHPIGATGARILTTLLYALKTLGKRRGLASLCIGGGEGVALMVERVEP